MKGYGFIWSLLALFGLRKEKRFKWIQAGFRRVNGKMEWYKEER